ncbi:hypothetical protein R3P38DRAFT_2387410, partial [Favolaschia claudopus]
LTMTDHTYSDSRKVLLTNKPNSYDPWEYRMRSEARVKKLLPCILGEDDEPTTGRNSRGWKAWR